jgi:low temperature requirement protein LtrA
MRPADLGHRLTKMVARDPNEAHRSATSLELLYDLAFVVAFAQAGEQLAHLLADGYVSEGIAGFALAMFAICWAWINFSWLASSFDTNDWLYRVMTMVQMVGVVVVALGLPAMFHSLQTGGHLDIRIMAAGYIVMRLATVAHWLRAIARSQAHRTASLAHAAFISFAQIAWATPAIADPPTATALVVVPVLILVELAGPVLAELRIGVTPWHARHLAERYGLLTIIALGEEYSARWPRFRLSSSGKDGPRRQRLSSSPSA